MMSLRRLISTNLRPSISNAELAQLLATLVVSKLSRWRSEHGCHGAGKGEKMLRKEAVSKAKHQYKWSTETAASLSLET
jgi:hypothetical protein